MANLMSTSGQPNTGSRTIVPTVIGRPYVGVTIPTGPPGPPGPTGPQGPPGGMILVGFAQQNNIPIEGPPADLPNRPDLCPIAYTVASQTRIRTALQISYQPSNFTGVTQISLGFYRNGVLLGSFRHAIVAGGGQESHTAEWFSVSNPGSYTFTFRAGIYAAGAGLVVPTPAAAAQFSVMDCLPNPVLLGSIPLELAEGEPGTPEEEPPEHP